MATQPTNDLLVWANTDVNLPNLAGPNKTEPSADLVAKGWDFKQKPSADEFNYILNNLGEHIAYLEGDLTYTFTGDVTGTVNTSGSEDATINLQVVDNSHNHTSANISDATSANNANKIVKRGASGEISVGDVTVNKVSNESTIIFPATANDPGFITHSETDDVARMKFSISDNNDTSDAFQFGNTQGGSFVPKFTIYGNGTVDSEGNITAPSFIGSLNGNANTATRWQTARTLTATGGATGTVTGIDGSSNITLNLTLPTAVTNIRLGTEVSFQISNATGKSQYATGYVLTGATNDGNAEVDTIYTRPIQQYINGTWYTIGNI